jgi:hypothetical protein
MKVNPEKPQPTRSRERLARQRPPWTRPEDYDHYIEGLRKAGWKGYIGPTK